MICDSIKNLKLYCGLSPDFKEVNDFIMSNDLEKTPPGRYTLKGDIYYMVQNYETKPESEGFFEAHRKFIDLQYVVSGKERHNYAHLSNLKVREQYNAEKDMASYDGDGTSCSLILNKGFFAVYFPEDAHMPNLRIGKDPEKMIKVVFKIPVMS